MAICKHLTVTADILINKSGTEYFVLCHQYLCSMRYLFFGKYCIDIQLIEDSVGRGVRLCNHLQQHAFLHRCQRINSSDVNTTFHEGVVNPQELIIRPFCLSKVRCRYFRYLGLSSMSYNGTQLIEEILVKALHVIGTEQLGVIYGRIAQFATSDITVDGDVRNESVLLRDT